MVADRFEDSECTELFRDLIRQIQIPDGQVNEVGEGLEIAKTTGTVLDDLDDTIQSFRDGIGQTRTDIGKDPVHLFLYGVNELADGLQPAFQGGGHPAFEILFCGPGRLVLPELFELIFEDPGTVNPAIAFS